MQDSIVTHSLEPNLKALSKMLLLSTDDQWSLVLVPIQGQQESTIGSVVKREI